MYPTYTLLGNLGSSNLIMSDRLLLFSQFLVVIRCFFLSLLRLPHYPLIDPLTMGIPEMTPRVNFLSSGSVHSTHFPSILFSHISFPCCTPSLQKINIDPFRNILTLLTAPSNPFIAFVNLIGFHSPN